MFDDFFDELYFTVCCSVQWYMDSFYAINMLLKLLMQIVNDFYYIIKLLLDIHVITAK